MMAEKSEPTKKQVGYAHSKIITNFFQPKYKLNGDGMVPPRIGGLEFRKTLKLRT